MRALLVTLLAFATPTAGFLGCFASRRGMMTRKSSSEKVEIDLNPSCKPPIGEYTPIASSPALSHIKGPFILDIKDPEPQADELSNHNILRILLGYASDTEVNSLVWKCLGYRPDGSGGWSNAGCFPKWREKYPNPPDFIGLTKVRVRKVFSFFNHTLYKVNLVASVAKKHTECSK